MLLRTASITAAPLVLALGCASAPSRAAAPAPAGWVLAWSDEFDGPAGAPPDPARWQAELGGHGWGNDELQTYTARPENVAQSGTGELVVTARRESFTGPDGHAREFTSARLKTQGLFEQAYGRFEARLRLPRGQGVWPAFWLLGADIGKVGWPGCGEIDVMENIGREPDKVHGTIHGPGYSGGEGPSATFTLPGGQAFADDFHVFAAEWEPEVVRFYVDGQLYSTRTPAHLPAGRAWVFDHPFFLLLNLAVGGHWPGPPTPESAFPQTLRADYVRVYRRAPG